MLEMLEDKIKFTFQEKRVYGEPDSEATIVVPFDKEIKLIQWDPEIMGNYSRLQKSGLPLPYVEFYVGGNKGLLSHDETTAKLYWISQREEWVAIQFNDSYEGHHGRDETYSGPSGIGDSLAVGIRKAFGLGMPATTEWVRHASPSALVKYAHQRIVIANCSKCDEETAVCNWDSDSDGASWTWIKWEHDCKLCGYHEEKEVQFGYNLEKVDYCELGNHPYKVEQLPEIPLVKNDV